MWTKYTPRVIKDAAQFNTASIEQVQSHYKAWVNEQDMADLFSDYRMFIVIDEERFQSMQDTPIPEECPLDLQHRVGYYVKLLALKGLWDIWRNMQDGDYMRKSYTLVREYRDVY